jgi:hypothetical protein
MKDLPRKLLLPLFLTFLTFAGCLSAADLAVTAASVLKSSSAKVSEGIAGATITAGQAVYIDTSDSDKIKLADADGTAPANTFAGIALHAALAGQPIKYATNDSGFTPGFTSTAGAVVYLSDVAGGLTATIGDLEAGDTITVVGVMTTTTVMNLNSTRGGSL